MITIYQLINPQNNSIFYVGRTKDPSVRLHSHCTNPQTKTGKELLEKKVPVKMHIIESVTNEEAGKRESFWINKLFSDGHPLENKPITSNCINHPPEIEWLKEMKYLLNLKAVAAEIGVPTKAFWNYCNGIHSLNPKWWPQTQKCVKAFQLKKP